MLTLEGKTIQKLNAPPSSGTVPDTGVLFKWETVGASGQIVINYRDENAVNYTNLDIEDYNPNAITAGIIKPASDSTSAITIAKADGTTGLMYADTINGRWGIGMVPDAKLSVKGSGNTNASAAFNLYNSDGNTIFRVYNDGYIAYGDSTGSIGGKFILYGKSGVSFSYTFSTLSGDYLSIISNRSGSTGLCVSSLGNFGVGITAPTAKLHLIGGTSTAGTSPVKFTAGTFTSTPEAGQMEFDGPSLTYTNNDAVRRKIVATDTNTLGVATLAAGTVTVSTTKVTANSRIMLTVQSLGTVTSPKAIAVTSRTAGTSFVITSADATDTSTIAWMIIEPI